MDKYLKNMPVLLLFEKRSKHPSQLHSEASGAKNPITRMKEGGGVDNE